ncbi:response regulator [Butyricicoccus sp. 1XD8-22]|nr:response regulator [Butyricicoccus sp. 1XD8-22]
MKELLIVDDNRGIRMLLEEVFSKDGYLVHLATNGAEAISIAENKDIHCVLLDMNLPDMNGIEILKTIVQFKKNIPFIMMSAYAEQDLIEKAKINGAIHFITKPFNIHELKELVSKFIKSHSELRVNEII